MKLNPALSTNILIAVSIVAVLYFTKNPLALMGLMFLQAWQPGMDGGEMQYTDAEADEQLYQDTEAGFTAKL